MELTTVLALKGKAGYSRFLAFFFTVSQIETSRQSSANKSWTHLPFPQQMGSCHKPLLLYLRCYPTYVLCIVTYKTIHFPCTCYLMHSSSCTSQGQCTIFTRFTSLLHKVAINEYVKLEWCWFTWGRASHTALVCWFPELSTLFAKPDWQRVQISARDSLRLPSASFFWTAALPLLQKPRRNCPSGG